MEGEKARQEGGKDQEGCPPYTCPPYLPRPYPGLCPLLLPEKGCNLMQLTWNVLPWPLPPQMPRMRGTLILGRSMKFLAMWTAGRRVQHEGRVWGVQEDKRDSRSH